MKERHASSEEGNPVMDINHVKAEMQEYFALNASQKPVNPKDRTQVISCEFAYKCPLEWNQLQSTDFTNIRYCNQCQEQVFYVRTDMELKLALYAGLCVAAVVMKEGQARMMLGVPSSSRG